MYVLVFKHHSLLKLMLFLDDPSLPTLVDQLMAHIQTPESRRVLERLEPEEQAEFRDLMLQIITDSGEEDMAILDRIAQFLSYHGAEIRYRQQPKQQEVDILAEFRALHAEDPIEDDGAEDAGECATQLTLSFV